MGVQLLSAAYLLKSVTFLAIYFAALWALLRWDTHRRASRLLKRWSALDADPSVSLSAQSLQWLDELLAPIRQHTSQVQSLTQRMESLRQNVTSS